MLVQDVFCWLIVLSYHLFTLNVIFSLPVCGIAMVLKILS
jgi:hypothetical protein